MPRYLGIDLAGDGRASGYAVLDEQARVIACGAAPDDASIVALAARHGATTVAIDCPLGLPEGLCCLDPACGCAPANAPGIRQSELAVRALGYGLYHTTKRTIIRGLVERGMRLRPLIEAQGALVIEVYPYATKAMLFGRRMPKKTTPEGRRWLLARLSAGLRGLDMARAYSHDELDALAAAWTALMYARGDAVALGDAREGEIIVPRVSRAPALPPAG